MKTASGREVFFQSGILKFYFDKSVIEFICLEENFCKFIETPS